MITDDGVRHGCQRVDDCHIRCSSNVMISIDFHAKSVPITTDSLADSRLEPDSGPHVDAGMK